MPIVIGALGTITTGLLKGLEDLEVGGRVETLQTTALLRTARTLKRVLETWGDLLSLKIQWKNYQLTLMWKTLKEWILIIKTRHGWLGKVIHRKMCKKFKFDHTKKWYMHNVAAVLENDTYKLRWDFGIHTNHLISTRRPDFIIINNNNNNNNKKKRICKSVDIAVPADHRIKLKEWEKKDKYLDLASELKKTMEHEGDNYIDGNRGFWYSN